MTAWWSPLVSKDHAGRRLQAELPHHRAASRPGSIPPLWQPSPAPAVLCDGSPLNSRCGPDKEEKTLDLLSWRQKNYNNNKKTQTKKQWCCNFSSLYTFPPNSGFNLCFISDSLHVCASLSSYKDAIPPLQKHNSELTCVKTDLKPECKH